MVPSLNSCFSFMPKTMQTYLGLIEVLHSYTVHGGPQAAGAIGLTKKDINETKCRSDMGPKDTRNLHKYFIMLSAHV